MPIFNHSIVSFMMSMGFECLSYGKMSPTLSKSWSSKFELMLPSNEKTGCRVTTHAWFTQGKLDWCFIFQSLNSGSITTDAICCTNHPTKGFWFYFSWNLTKHIQATQRFSIKLVKHYKLFCRPLMNDSIVLGSEHSTCWPRCSSLSNMPSIIYMLTHWL